MRLGFHLLMILPAIGWFLFGWTSHAEPFPLILEEDFESGVGR